MTKKPKLTKQQRDVKLSITAEMAEDAWSEVNDKIRSIINRAAEQLPDHIFQEVHTSGRFWNKKTYYTYSRYFEGTMMPVSQYPAKTIKEIDT